MSTFEELEAKVKSLTPQELAEFREWFQRYEDEVWDRKIRDDQAKGKFDASIEAAREEADQDKPGEL
ncbi:hypothetical protein GC170_22040 [bacterium]|nr:hypothetical protein [bacterium]